MPSLRLTGCIVALVISAAMLTALIGPAAAQSPPFPDGIRFADTETIILAGENYTAVLQVMSGGGDYPMPNIGIYMSTNNSTILELPEYSFIASNATGMALFNFTVADVAGDVNITARMLDRKGGIGATKTYHVVMYNDLRGLVKDGAGKGIPRAQVTLYTNDGGNLTLVQVPNNPAVTDDNGTYYFNRLPSRLYYIETTAGIFTGGLNYTLGTGTISGDIVLAGYGLATPTPSPEPTMVPTGTPTMVPTETPTTMPTPTPAPSGDTLRQVWWIVTVALVIAGIFVVIKIFQTRR